MSIEELNELAFALNTLFYGCALDHIIQVDSSPDFLVISFIPGSSFHEPLVGSLTCVRRGDSLFFLVQFQGELGERVQVFTSYFRVIPLPDGRPRPGFDLPFPVGLHVTDDGGDLYVVVPRPAYHVMFPARLVRHNAGNFTWNVARKVGVGVILQVTIVLGFVVEYVHFARLVYPQLADNDVVYRGRH